MAVKRKPTLMAGELTLGLSLSAILVRFSDIFWSILMIVAMVREDRSDSVAARRDMLC